jgi:hypothetical protein
MLAALLEAKDRIVLEERHEAAARKLVEDLDAAKDADLKTMQRAMILLLTVARAQGKP